MSFHDDLRIILIRRLAGGRTWRCFLCQSHLLTSTGTALGTGCDRSSENGWARQIQGQDLPRAPHESGVEVTNNNIEHKKRAAWPGLS